MGFQIFNRYIGLHMCDMSMMCKMYMRREIKVKRKTWSEN